MSRAFRSVLSRLPAGSRPMLVALMLGPVVGCGSSEPHPETAAVKGKVTYKGQPLIKGNVNFQPEKGQPAVGQIQPDGTYTLSTYGDGDGAVLGRHKVAILAHEDADPADKKSKPKDLVPKKYQSASTSGLDATVSKDSKEINFDLK